MNTLGILLTVLLYLYVAVVLIDWLITFVMHYRYFKPKKGEEIVTKDRVLIQYIFVIFATGWGAFLFIVVYRLGI